MTDRSADPGLVIVYDGQCPFCTSYVRMLRLRESFGHVELVDARSDHPAVHRVRERGFDLDEGMALQIGDAYYHGPDVITQLALMSSKNPSLNRMFALMFRSPRRSRVLYPFLRAGRNATLRLLGKKPINAG